MSTLTSADFGDETWRNMQRELLAYIYDVYAPPPLQRLGADRQEENALLTIVSGFMSVADWIGSCEDYFPYVNTPLDLDAYVQYASDKAAHALVALQWTGWQPPASPRPFADMFPFPSIQHLEGDCSERPARCTQTKAESRKQHIKRYSLTR